MRVVRRSGVAGFDEAAVRAIRRALPEVTAPRPAGGRRSRWSFEVSDAADTLTVIRGGGDDGWRQLPEASNGV